MAVKNQSFLKNENRDFDNILDSVVTKNDLSFIDNSNFGLDSSIGLPICTGLGLNPTWILNFGDSIAAKGNDQPLDVLTPLNRMFRLSLAAHALASQGTAVTAAQAKQIFGVAANDGAIFNLTGNTTVTTNIIPATLTVNTITGTTAADFTLNDSATDLASANDRSLILFNDYTLEDGHALTIGLNAANEMDAASCEFVTNTTAGTNVFEREAATTDAHQDIIFTADGDTTIMPGSFLYLNASNNSDEMTIKCFLRTSAGKIAITTAN